MKSSVVHPLAVGIAVLLGYLPVSVRADILYTSGLSSIDKVPSSGVATTLDTVSLNNPQGIAFSLSGTLYVANFGSDSIEKFSQTGMDLGTFYSGTALSGPIGMAFDSAGNLYVANQESNTIEKISSTGQASVFVPATAGLTTPSALAFDSAGNLYVASYGSDAIQKFSATGTSLGTFASGSTILSGPDGLAFDAAGNLYATNSTTNTIEKFTSTGTPSLFASTGLSTPVGLAFDSAGNLYAANSGNGTIEKFSSTGNSSLFSSGFGISSPEYLAFTTNAGIPVLGSSAVLASLQYWNGSVTNPNGSVNGGAGTWDNTTTNWTNAAGSTSAVWGSTSGVFAGTAGTVTLGATISFNTIEFQTDGYVINPDAGNLFSLKPVGSANVISDDGVTATINAPLTGTGSLTKAGTGTLILAGANTYTGATTILNGTLLAGLGFTIPSASAVFVDAGATLDLDGLSQTVASIADGPNGGGTISLGGGILTTGGGNTSTSFSGAIQDGGVSGQTQGQLTKVGTGTLTLSGINTYTGPTTINAGAVQFAKTTSLDDTTSTTTVNADAHSLIVASNATAIFNTGGTGEFTPAQILALAALGSATGGFESGSSIGIDTTNAPGAVVLGSGIANPNGGANVLNVIKYGTGTLTFGAANTYTGTTTIAAGELITTVAGALPSGTSLTLGTDNSAVTGELDLFGTNQTIRSLSVTPGNTGGTGNIITSTNGPATLTFGAGNSSFTGLITGPISLVKGGAFNTSVTLAAANTYTGSTTIQTGQLRIGVDNALPITTTLTVEQADGQGLEPAFFLVHHNQTLAALNFVAGYQTNAQVDVQGGVLTLNGNVMVVNNTTLPGFGGASSIEDSTGGGALDLGNATRTFTVAGQGIQAQDLQILAIIRGNGGVVLNATPSSLDASEGGVVFGAANTYTGSTTVAQGRLTTTVPGALPATTDLILGTASSALAGDVDLNGTSQTVNSLSVANLNTAGAGNFITSNNGPATLTINSTTTNSTFGNLLTGSVSLVKAGAGTTLTLTSTNSYTGTTTVNSGTLNLTGSINGGGAVIVNSGTLALAASGSIGATSPIQVNLSGTLSGTGEADGAVTVALGGNLSPGGATPGTLTLGSLILNAGANSNFRLAQAGIAGGGVNDLVNVTGNLTLGGNLNVTTLAGFGFGSYTLFTYGGLLTNNGFSAININGNYTTTIVTGVAGEVDLTVSAGTSQYWDGTGTINDGVISGGTGNWSATANNWTSFDGSANSTWQNGTAVFAAPGGTVTLTSSISALGLTFASTGYVLAGTNTLTLLGPTPTISVTGAGNSATVGVKLAGTAGLTANGAGTLILTNAANSYTGGTTILNGTVQIGTATAIGSLGSGAISVNTNGTLALVNMAGNALSANISNGVGGVGTVSVNSKNTNTLSGALTDSAPGQLALSQSGVGTTILTNSGNSYSGATTVSAGILQVGTTTLAGSIGATSAVTVGTGGTLSLINVAGNTLANNVTGGLSGTGLVSINSTKNVTLSGNLSDGAGLLALTKSGTGIATLSGNNTYGAATTVSAGTLQIGNGAGSFTATGNITAASAATVSVDLPDTSVLVANIVLSGATSTLKTIQSGATNTLNGVISGTGAVNQSGTGTTVLTATETYTGATSVTAGTLEIDGALAAASTVAVGTSGTLKGQGTIHGKATLTGNGTIDLTSSGIIGGTLAVTGGNWTGDGTVTGLVTSSSGLFNINGDFTASAGMAVTGGTIAGSAAYTGSLNYTSSASSTFGGAINGTGATVTMNKASSTLTLTGANNYTGTTTVSAGTLQLGDGVTTLTTLGTGAITVSGTGTLAINLSDSSNFTPNVNLTAAGATLKAVGSETNQISGVISGTGGFAQAGTGITALLGTNTYTGVTNVTAGILEVDGSLAAGSTVNVGTVGTLRGTGTIHGKATLTGGGTINFSTGGNISGTLAIMGGNWIGAGAVGGLVTSSSGAFNLGGTLTAPTGLAVTGGTIAGAGMLAGNLNYTSSASSTFAGIIKDGTASSTLIMNHASSTLILTGNNSYTGTTTVSAGTLQLGDGVTTETTLGTGTITVSGTGTLAINLSDSSNFTPNVNLTAAGATLKAVGSETNQISGVISGTGGFAQAGTGITALLGTNTYTGVTNVTAGILEVDGSLAAGSTVNVGTVGTLRGTGTIHGKATLTGGGTINFSTGGNISGTLAIMGGNWIGAGAVGGLVTSSSGAFNLGGTLTAPTGLAVTGGTIAGAGMLAGNLNYTSSASSTFAGIIEDGTVPSTLIMNHASSTLILTGANSYMGATTISAGTLQLGDGSATESSLGAGALTASGTGALALDLPGSAATFSRNVSVTAAGASVKAIQSGTTTLSGLISGLGGLAQSGPGTTIVTGAETYTGTTSITAGTLQVDGSLVAGSNANVAAGGTLSGTGTVAGTVNVLSGGTLSAGDGTGPGTLTVGKLVLSAGSNSDFRLNALGTVGGGVNDLVTVHGNLTIAGNLNITPLANFGAAIGSYTLFSYTGTLTGTGFSAINGTAGYTVAVVTGVPHEVDLQVLSIGMVTQYWDGTGVIGNNIINGGGGTWNGTTKNWTDSAGAANATWQGGMAVFDAPGGTVNLAAPMSAQGLTFGSTGYVIAGASPLNLVGTPTVAPTIGVSAGATATISAPITGNAGLSASGAGTLILTSMTNSYTGGTTVTNGTVQIGTTAAAGSIGGGTISVGSSGTLTLVNVHGNLLANNITNSSAAMPGTLIINSTLANTLSGELTDGTGTLALTQSGSGTTILTNAGNNFSGATTISKGTLQIGTATAPGSLGSNTTVSMGAASTLLLVNVAGNLLTNNISNGVSGTALVNVNSTGSNILTGSLTNGAGLLALTQSGTGTTILTGSDAYTGATTVSAGSLQVGNGTIGTLSSASAVTVNGTGTLATDLADTSVFSNSVTLNAAGANLKAVQSGTNTLSGVISGTGAVKQSGTGTTILTAANTYKGGTTVSSGTLLVNNTTGSATGTGAVTINGGTLGGSGTISGATTLNSGGTLFPGAGSVGTPGTALHASSLIWNGGGTLTLQLGASANDALALTGALTKGSAGAYTVNIVDDGISLTNYTLATFASTTFTATTFQLELPNHYIGHLVETPTQLILDVTATTDIFDLDEPAHTDSVASSDPATSGDPTGTSSPAGFGSDTFIVTPTPEPGSALLLAFGGAGLLGWRRRRR